MLSFKDLEFHNLVDAIFRDLMAASLNPKVVNFMRPAPSVLTEDATLKEAIKIILDEKIDGVPIVNENNELSGIVTKTHALRAIYNNENLDVNVKDVMKPGPLQTGPDYDSVQLLKIPIGSIPVVDNSKIVGMVTTSETVRACFTSFVVLLEELKSIITSAPSGIVTSDNSVRVRIINPQAEKMLEMPSKEVLGQQISNNFLRLNMAEVIKTGETMVGKKLFFKDKIFFVTISPIRHLKNIIGAKAVLQDISQFDSISEELKYTRELKGYMDSIIESSYDGIYLTDNFGKIVRVNDAFTRITGVPKEEILYKTSAELVDEGIFKRPIPLDNISKDYPVSISQQVKTGKSVLITCNPIYEDKTLSGIVHNVRDITELNKIKKQLEKAESLSKHYWDQLKSVKTSGKFVGNSLQSRELIQLVLRMSKIDATILLLGESGVGKDLIAEIIHENSPRNQKLMVTVNCSAIPENLIESELFGYEPGAFTGAGKKGKIGLFELANESTLFLDEIGDLPLALQPKLLRVIQNREVTKIGGKFPQKIDVRIIAATNRPLKEMVEQNQFREDLYYRLNVVPINIPPLRKRIEDIPELVGHFTRMYNKKYNFNKRFSENVIRKLMGSDWPGNARELENVVERSVVTSKDDIIRDIEYLGLQQDDNQNLATCDLPLDIDYKNALDDYDRQLLTNALQKFKTTRKAAEQLGVSQPTIIRKAKKYGIPLKGRVTS